MHLISEKIGAGMPIGMVFESRIPTGEIAEANIPGRWPITTRILRLRGVEPKNLNTHERLIYIHGTPAENDIGMPASSGCIRMRSADIVELFDLAREGTRVEIVSNTKFAQLPVQILQSIRSASAAGGLDFDYFY